MPSTRASNIPAILKGYGVPSHQLIRSMLTTGQVFYVHSGTGSDSHRGDRPTRPVATLDKAIGLCRANNGDKIIIMPNHAETITAAGGITADVAGVEILGMGRFNQRPRFLMDAAAADVAVSAADVTIENCVFAAGFADVVRCFNVTAAGFSTIYNEFADNAVNENFLTPIKATSTTDNNADGLRVIGNRWISPDAAGLEFIEFNADLDGIVVEDNVAIHEGTASPLILGATGKDLTHAFIVWNYLSHKMTANELLINIDTSANSGICAHNRVGHADVTTTHDLGIDGLGFRLFDNLSVSTDALSGLVLPAIDVDS